MMYLVVDTETHDLPRDWRAPISDLNNWPRLVQVGWLEFDSVGNEKGRFACLVRPEGFAVSPAAQRVHGISTAMASRDGRELATVLDRLAESLSRTRVVVAHNIDFDSTVLSAEYVRAGRSDPLAPLRKVCTMKGAAVYCNLPGAYGPKWPKLEELYMHLFGGRPGRSHDALADAEACSQCFFELRRRGVPAFR